MRSWSWLSAVALPVALSAQTTWIVNPGGGPGVHFTDLPPAVAAASDGDTIRVQWGPFLTGVSGFTTNKGLTIVGESRVFLYTEQAPVLVNGLPAGRTFRLVGFEAPRGSALWIRAENCAGAIHLENLHAVEPGPMAPSSTPIGVRNCAQVTLRDVETFGGASAVTVVNSTAVLTGCRLGTTSLGLGGGQALEAIDSDVDIVEPRFQTADAQPCVRSVRSRLRIAGSSAGYILGGIPSIAWPGTAVSTFLGTVHVDPQVQVASTPPSQPAIVGTAVVTTGFVPAVWCGQAVPGQVLSIRATQSANSTLLQCVGLPGPITPTALGDVWLDLPSISVLAIVPSTPAGVAVTTVAIPAGLPLGSTFAAQSVVLHGSAAELGRPVVFAVH